MVGAGRDHQVPILPGVTTASDIMRVGIELQTFKFLPVETNAENQTFHAQFLLCEAMTFWLPVPKA